MPQRALVTGGAGFIGSHICDLFLSHGYAVEIIDDLSSGKHDNVAAPAKLHVCDVRTPDAARLIRDGKFDVVIHLAAQMDVRKSVADPAFDASVNIQGALNLTEAIRHLETRPRLIFASTGGAVYGDFVQPPNAETAPKDPESPYGIAKLSVEHYLAYYGRVQGLDYVALRFANVYGPRQDPHGQAGVVAIFCKRVKEGTALTVFGDGGQTRDYVYVGDVAQAAFAAATTGMPAVERLDSRAFNVGTGVETSVMELANTLMRAAGKKVTVEHAPERRGEQRRSSVDVTKAAKTLGWRPAVSLEQGLKKTYDWFAARR